MSPPFAIRMRCNVEVPSLVLNTKRDAEVEVSSLLAKIVAIEFCVPAFCVSEIVYVLPVCDIDNVSPSTGKPSATTVPVTSMPVEVVLNFKELS